MSCKSCIWIASEITDKGMKCENENSDMFGKDVSWHEGCKCYEKII